MLMLVQKKYRFSGRALFAHKIISNIIVLEKTKTSIESSFLLREKQQQFYYRIRRKNTSI